MTLSGSDLLQIAQAGGATGALILVVLALYKGWFVPGFIYRAICRDRDDWKEIALTGTNAAEKALEQSERRRRRRGGDDENAA